MRQGSTQSVTLNNQKRTMTAYLNRSDERRILADLKASNEVDAHFRKTADEAKAAEALRVEVEQRVVLEVIALRAGRARLVQGRGFPALRVTSQERADLAVKVMNEIMEPRQKAKDDFENALKTHNRQLAADKRRLDGAFYMTLRQSAVAAARIKHDDMQHLAGDCLSSSDEFDDHDYHKKGHKNRNKK